jgi:hypothetical protein
MRLANESERRSHNSSRFNTRDIVMALESTIIELVETIVRHPVFAGSDKAVDLVLDDLESLERSGQIGQATYRRLLGMILRSPHVVACR